MSTSSATASTNEQFATNALGSTIALSDGSGTVRTSYTYEPYGATTTGGAPTTNAFGFTGRETDGNGVSFHRARYYDSTLSRFLSEDPVGYWGNDSNLYSYARLAPLDIVDLLGLQGVPAPPGGPPNPPPPGKNGQPNSWVQNPTNGRWEPQYPVSSPKGGQPNVTWDGEDGWWRYNDGQGGKVDHVNPDGSHAPDSRRNVPRPIDPPDPAPPSWWPPFIPWPLPPLTEFPIPIVSLCLLDPSLCLPPVGGRSCGTE